VNPLPLTTSQQAALDALVTANRLRTVPVDLMRAELFLASADECLSDVQAFALKPKSRHRLCYDAAHDVVEAFMAAYGYRTTSGPGQHQALGEAIVALLDAPPAVAQVAMRFDGLRQARNSDHYTAAPITEAGARAAEDVATTFQSEARSRLRP
jgi:hypothetical protein